MPLITDLRLPIMALIGAASSGAWRTGAGTMSAAIATAAPEPAALTIATGVGVAMRAAAAAGDDAALAALEHAAAWTVWVAWAAAHAAPPLPARARDVRAYLVERAAAGRSIATLRAAAAVHRAAGQRGPCEPRGVVSATLARLAKLVATDPVQPKEWMLIRMASSTGCLTRQESRSRASTGCRRFWGGSACTLDWRVC